MNGEHALIKEIHTRGQSTVYFRRKSYAITFDKKVGIMRNGKAELMKHVDALNLAMDKNYVNNRL